MYFLQVTENELYNYIIKYMSCLLSHFIEETTHCYY